MAFSLSGYFSATRVCYDSCGLLLLVSSLPPLSFFFFFSFSNTTPIVKVVIWSSTSSHFLCLPPLMHREFPFSYSHFLSPNISSHSLRDYVNCQGMVNKYAIIMLNTVSCYCYFHGSDASYLQSSVQSGSFVYSAPMCLLRVLHVQCREFPIDKDPYRSHYNKPANLKNKKKNKPCATFSPV